MIPEELDLAQLTRTLMTHFGGRRPAGYVPGHTAIRDAVMASTDCSAMEAEDLVATLESRGYIRFTGSKGDRVDSLENLWVFDPSAP